jgi:hypothetical protein
VLQVALLLVVVFDAVVGALGFALESHEGGLPLLAGGQEEKGTGGYQKASGTVVPNASVFIMYIHYLLTMNLRVVSLPFWETIRRV